MSGSRMHLLLVEDNPGDARLLTEMLREHSELELSQVEDLASALTRCEEREPDVVLLDLGLPDSQGLLTLSRLQERFPHVPLVVLTGNDDLEHSLEAVKLGAQDYLVKGSVSGPLLVRAVRYARERKHSEEALRESEESLKRTNRELQEATAQLIQSAKLTALGELAAGVAHELNQPLNAMGIICQSMMRYLPDYSTEQLMDELREVMRLIVAMRTIIDQLRVFARPSESEQRPLNINTAIERTLTFVARQIGDDGIVLRTACAPDLPPVLGQLSRLEQLFLNLVINARDALLEPGRTDRRLEIRTYLAQGAEPLVVVEVRDNGPGIPEAVQQKLFTPFFTTKALGKGTGLGLSIARKIVDEHGGTIELESRSGEGTVFRVKLPPAERG